MVLYLAFYLTGLFSMFQSYSIMTGSGGIGIKVVLVFKTALLYRDGIHICFWPLCLTCGIMCVQLDTHLEEVINMF